VYRERVGISLYDALHEKNAGSTPGYFSPELIQTVAQTLARFRYICDQYSVPMNQINVFATEATRTSKNKDQLLDAINKSSGLKVEILSKEMESMFGAMGARSGFTHVNGLFMDLGGGSVQMTYVNSKVEGYDLNAARFAVSMPYGAARLSEAIKSKSDAPEIIEELQTTMKKTFSGMMSNFAPLKAQVESKEGVSIYFCGGGFRGYGSMLMHTHEIQPYPIPAIGGFKVPGERFIRYKEMIKANDGKEKVFGMSKRRREQFRAIAAVVKALVGSIPNIKEVVFCSGGNREGVLFMKLPPNIREGNPLVLLPGYASQRNPLQFLDMIGSIINQGIPNECPPIFSNELRHYINRNIWIDMGNPDDANSAEALHDPISGEIAGLPGLTHEIRAVLALTLCSRWGADLGPTDQELYKRLQSLVGQKLSFWCEYIGTLVRLLATIFPAYPADMNFMKESIQ
jgi:retrograde regulation protein 2